MKQHHNFPPLYDANSRILILGSFPSVKSREAQFFYGHPQNRFWKVLSALLDEPLPQNIAEKRHMLLKNKIALWDVIAECDIEGSADSSISQVKANDISVILQNADIAQIFTNGQTAGRLYAGHILPQTKRKAICLPSTSPANAAFGMSALCEKWSVILTFLKQN